MSISFVGPVDPTDSESKHTPMFLACVFEPTGTLGESVIPPMRGATEHDLFRAGFTPQSVAMDEIRQRIKVITGLKRRNTEILEILKNLVSAIKSAQEEGFTFEEFSSPEDIQEALEQAEELLEEEDMDP